VSGPLPDVHFQTKWLSRNPLVRYANGRFRDTLLAFVRACAPHTILDAGCGEGINLLTLSNEGSWKLQGIDLDEASLAIARDALGDGIPLLRGDLEQLPFDDRSFDLVIGTEVLEHVQCPERALAELARVSRRHLVLSVPREPLWCAANMARGKYLLRLGNTPGHLNHWSGAGFTRFCAREVRVLERRNPGTWTFLRCERS
jgi:2-polyprenyl-3-methyl-5-hydroxy-6-metoxy-1,4-benzoquinol methylase